MAQESIQDIIQRIQNARDRCQNAGDHQGVLDANNAILDLQSLRASALPSAREIEDYFNQRIAGRAKPTQGGGGTRAASSSSSWSDDS